MSETITTIYTDGSYNPTTQVGGWAAIIHLNGEKITLTGQENSTTHQRMELTAVIEALQYLALRQRDSLKVIIYTDSQYVTGLPGRKERLLATNFVTRNSTTLQNTDLIKKMFAFDELLRLEFVKVKAHQKKSVVENLNREVDKLSRRIVRTNSNS
jgi:ribonuclease HI